MNKRLTKSKIQLITDKLMRRIGPMGALIDEYERALKEFILCTQSLDQDKFTRIIDKKTLNPNCKSFQSVITHVIRAGYAYSNSIRFVFKIPRELNLDQITIGNHTEIEIGLNQMFLYMLDTLKDHMEIQENDFSKINIPVTWNQNYDIEQLIEHAIVHILRHRRQIEGFWLGINQKK